MDFAVLTAPPQIGEELRELRGRMLPPSCLGQTVARDIEGQVSPLHAVLKRTLPTAERTE